MPSFKGEGQRGDGQRGDGQGKGMNEENQDTFFTLPNIQSEEAPPREKPLCVH